MNKKPWAAFRVPDHESYYFGVICPGFLNQVPTLCLRATGRLHGSLRASKTSTFSPGLGFRVWASSYRRRFYLKSPLQSVFWVEPTLALGSYAGNPKNNENGDYTYLNLPNPTFLSALIINPNMEFTGTRQKSVGSGGLR